MQKESKPTLSRSQQKRCDIVLAAERVFIENGYQAANMDRIAELANVSKRTVYNHFASKEILFQHITNLLIESVENSSTRPYSPDQPLAKQLTDVLSGAWDALTSERLIVLSRVILSEYMRNPEMSQQTMERIANSEDGLNAWIKAAAKDKRLKKINVDVAATILRGAIKEACHAPMLFCDLPAPSAKDKAFMLKEIVGMFLGRYGVGE